MTRRECGYAALIYAVVFGAGLTGGMVIGHLIKPINQIGLTSFDIPEGMILVYDRDGAPHPVCP